MNTIEMYLGLGWIFIAMYLLRDYVGTCFRFVWFLRKILRCKFIVDNQSEYKSNKKHNAIIAPHTFHHTELSTYLDGVDILVKYFSEHKIPYKVYDCYTPQDFKKVVFNKKATKLWIFGHGAKHCASFGKKENIYYCKLRTAPKKEYVAQFHCNPGSGESLGDYLAPENKFVEGHSYLFGLFKGNRSTYLNRKDVVTELKRLYG